MALILCIESATTVCSVALCRGGQVIAFKELNEGYTHAENLTVFIQDVCREAEASIRALDAVAISAGPGSYTGLRIGVSAAKGLCYALEKPLIAVSTLQALANNFIIQYPNAASYSTPPASHPLIIPMLDARRMEVYCAQYDFHLNEIESVSPKIIDENTFASMDHANEIYFIGDGVEKCKPLLQNRSNAKFYPHVLCSAKGLGLLAEKKFNLGKFEDVAYFEPFYLKEFVAGKHQS